jgi:hypothetical protein
MPRPSSSSKKKKKTPAATRTVVPLAVPSTPAEQWRLLERISGVPDPIRLPRFDAAAELAAMARDRGLDFEDATPELGWEHNAQLAACVHFVEALARRARERPRTLLVVVATAANVEAVQRHLGALYQVSLFGQYARQTALHALGMLGDEVACAFDLVDDRQALRNCFAALLPDWECVVCLAERAEVDASVAAFECCHSLCRACFLQAETLAHCPVCRARPLARADARLLASS